MKNSRKILLVFLVFSLAMPSFISCKKGDGDPFFSLNSRKARLTGDWKVTTLKQTVKCNRTTITTNFDGNKKTVEIFVPDTVVYTPTDTLWEYRKFSSFTGTLLYTFDKDGNYQVDEVFTNDTNQVQYTSQEVGLWFFTGGGRDSDTKSKELLGLQPLKFVFNPLSPDTYTYTYSGQNIMNIFHIYELATKEIDLRSDIVETTNLWTISTNTQIILQPQ